MTNHFNTIWVVAIVVPVAVIVIVSILLLWYVLSSRRGRFSRRLSRGLVHSDADGTVRYGRRNAPTDNPENKKQPPQEAQRQHRHLDRAERRSHRPMPPVAEVEADHKEIKDPEKQVPAAETSPDRSPAAWRLLRFLSRTDQTPTESPPDLERDIGVVTAASVEGDESEDPIDITAKLPSRESSRPGSTAGSRPVSGVASVDITREITREPSRDQNRLSYTGIGPPPRISLHFNRSSVLPFADLIYNDEGLLGHRVSTYSFSRSIRNSTRGSVLPNGRDSIVRDSIVRDSIVRDSIVRDSIVRDSIVRDSVRDSTARDSTARHSTARHSTARDSTTRHSAARDSRARNSTARDSTAHDSTTHDSTTRDSTRDSTRDITIRDSFLRDSVMRDSFLRGSFSRDSFSRDSLRDSRRATQASVTDENTSAADARVQVANSANRSKTSLTKTSSIDTTRPSRPSRSSRSSHSSKVPREVETPPMKHEEVDEKKLMSPLFSDDSGERPIQRRGSSLSHKSRRSKSSKSKSETSSEPLPSGPLPKPRKQKRSSRASNLSLDKPLPERPKEAVDQMTPPSRSPMRHLSSPSGQFEIDSLSLLKPSTPLRISHRVTPKASSISQSSLVTARTSHTPDQVFSTPAEQLTSPVGPSPRGLQDGFMSSDEEGVVAIVEQVCRVTTSFKPNLYDEMALQRGEQVVVFKLFDDGWCTAQRLEEYLSGSQVHGVCPQGCLSPI